MANPDEVVLLRVQLDESATKGRLASLVLDIEKTQAATRALNATRKDGTITEAEYSAQVVELAKTMREQRTEQTALTKNLDLYTRAVNGVAGSYDQAQAQLSLAQRQYQQLGESASNSTEETQALATVIDTLRNGLKKTDGEMSLFVRNTGNYSGAIEPLIAELKRLEIQQETMAKDGPDFEAQKARVVGFQQAINRAGAEAGLTYDQTQAKLREYGAAIAPVVKELVKLENEQTQVAEGSEQYARIGFQMQQLKKDVAEAAAEPEKLGGALASAAGETEVLGGAIGQLNAAKERYTQIVNLAKLATAGEVTVLGGLRLALIATGVGAFVVILGSLIAFLTKSQAGTEFLNRKLAALGGIVTLLTRYVVDFGEKIFNALSNPKQALQDLIEGIGTNLMNRLRAFGVLFDAIKSGNFSKLNDGVIQLSTGITNATARAKAFGDELGAAATAAEKLAAAERALQRAEDDNIDTNKRLLNEVERLKNIRDNESELIATRRAANEKAYATDLAREKTLADLALRRVELLKAQINAEGGRDRVSRERYQELKNAENELSDIREDAAGKQNEFITARFSLAKEETDKVKEASAAQKEAVTKALDAKLAALQIELKARLGFLELELDKVAEGSEEELNILRRKLTTERELELSAKALSVRERALIEAQYSAASQQLTEEAAGKQLAQQLDNARALLTAQLLGLREGSAEELALKNELINKELAADLAALDKRADNAAKIAELQANAAKQRADNEFAQALAGLENELTTRATRINRDYAEGLITKKQQEDSLLAIERAGAEARLVAAQDYGRSTEALQADLASKEAAALDKKVADEALALEKRRGYEDARLAAATAVTDGVIGLFDEETVAGRAALVFKKTLALAEIAINLSRELSAIGTAAAANPLNIPTAGLAGISQATILSALAIGKAAVLAAKVLVFRRGGLAYEPDGHVAQGPSHEGGGIPVYSRRSGRAMGIEIEGGEPVLTAAVSRSPSLLAAASAINVAAGGRPLVPGRYMALGGLATAPAGLAEAMAPPVAPIDYAALGEATAAALRKAPPRVVVSDVQAGLARAEFTDGMANS